MSTEELLWEAVHRAIPRSVTDKARMVQTLKLAAVSYRAMREVERKVSMRSQFFARSRKVEDAAYKRVRCAINELAASLTDLEAVLATGEKTVTADALAGRMDRENRTRDLRRLDPANDSLGPSPSDEARYHYAASRTRYVAGFSPLALATEGLHERLTKALAEQVDQLKKWNPSPQRGAPAKRSAQLLVLFLAEVWTSSTGADAPDRTGLWKKFAEEAWMAAGGGDETIPSDLAKALRQARKARKAGLGALALPSLS